MADTAGSQDGRTRLVEAALACLAEHGHQGTTVRKIAERAGVTAGLVRHHFDSKDALLVETYRLIHQDALDRMARAKTESGDTLDSALDRAIRAFFPENMTSPNQMRIMVAFWGLVLTNPDIAAIQNETYSAFQNFFAELIRDHVGPTQDAHAIASGIIAIADGLWLECCLNPAWMTPETAVQTAVEFSRARLGL